MLSDWAKFYYPRASQFPTPLSPELAAEVRRVQKLMDQYWQAYSRLQGFGLTSDVNVAAPDWTVSTTDALAVEVQKYVERVNAATAPAAGGAASPK
jgi:hypothetical protein